MVRKIESESNMTNNRPVLVAANVLLSGQGEILLHLRADLMKWECPGGKVEDETVLEAALREQEEESGILLRGTPQVLGFIDGHGHTDLKQRFVVIYLLWTQWDGFPEKREENTLRWQWFKVNDMPANDACSPGLRRFISDLLPPVASTVQEEDWDGQDIEPPSKGA
jgi:8-oxo-dGTP pyrophosphatase MutT (NUDIX family)